MAHILVVDDEPMIRFLVRSIFESVGHNVYEAQDGLVALGMLELYPPLFDIIVLDLQMPLMDGVTFLSTLPIEMAYPPIIVLTAHGGVVQKTLGYQVSGWLTKPFRKRDLLDMVNSRLNRGQLLS